MQNVIFLNVFTLFLCTTKVNLQKSKYENANQKIIISCFIDKKSWERLLYTSQSLISSIVHFQSVKIDKS